MLSFFRPGQTIAQAVVQPSVQSVLWKIKAPGAVKTSYLLGTCHPFGKSWVDANPVLYRYIKECRTFICESYTGKDTTAGSLIDSISVNKPVKTAAALFGADTTLVNDHFLQVGWVEKPTDVLNEATSFSEQIGLIMLMCYSLEYQLIKPLGVVREDTGMDKALVDYATDEGKFMIGLDNVEGLSGINFTEGPGSFCGVIVQLIRWIDNVNMSAGEQKKRDEHLAYINLYKTGLRDYGTDRIEEESDDLSNVLERNRLWISKLLPLLKQGSCFIAVGAGHLFAGSNEGLISLLRDRGYIVTPVRLENK